MNKCLTFVYEHKVGYIRELAEYATKLCFSLLNNLFFILYSISKSISNDSYIL